MLKKSPYLSLYIMYAYKRHAYRKKKHAYQFCGTLPLSTVRAHELINGEFGIKSEAGKIL